MTQIPERPGMITRKQLMDRLDVPNVDISVGLCTVKYVSVVGVWFYDIREACDAMKEFYDKRIYDTELIDRGRGRPLRHGPAGGVHALER